MSLKMASLSSMRVSFINSVFIVHGVNDITTYRFCQFSYYHLTIHTREPAKIPFRCVKCSVDCLMVVSAISIQYIRVTDRQTDRHVTTAYSAARWKVAGSDLLRRKSLAFVCHVWSLTISWQVSLPGRPELLNAFSIAAFISRRLSVVVVAVVVVAVVVVSADVVVAQRRYSSPRPSCFRILPSQHVSGLFLLVAA